MNQKDKAALVVANEEENFRLATNIAGLCKEIVLKSTKKIGDRRYVMVEGWMSIATAHGCIASIREVRKTEDGIIAVAEVKRQSDGAVLTIAEGFVGKDEPTWYGGTVTFWNRNANQEESKTLPPRPEYAIRAMAQTRAISRACRTAFAHVVVLMNENLQTTPYEEVGGEEDPPSGAPDGGKAHTGGAAAPAPGDKGKAAAPAPAPAAPDPEIVKLREQFRGGKWRDVVCHLTWSKKFNGKKLGELADAGTLGWLQNDWNPKLESDDDKMLRAALDVSKEEIKS